MNQPRRILFDHNVPAPLRHVLFEYEVSTAGEKGWMLMSNGKLLDAAENAEFDILLTGDKGFQHQQNLANRKICIVILNKCNWPIVRKHISSILDALKDSTPGTCTLVE